MVVTAMQGCTCKHCLENALNEVDSGRLMSLSFKFKHSKPDRSIPQDHLKILQGQTLKTRLLNSMGHVEISKKSRHEGHWTAHFLP